MSTLTFKQRTALHPKATIAMLVALLAAGIVTAVLLLALTGSNSGASLPTVESPTIQQAPAVNSAGTGAIASGAVGHQLDGYRTPQLSAVTVTPGHQPRADFPGHK